MTRREASLIWFRCFLLKSAPSGVPDKAIALGTNLELVKWSTDGSVTTIGYKPTEIWYDEAPP